MADNRQQMKVDALRKAIEDYKDKDNDTYWGLRLVLVEEYSNIRQELRYPVLTTDRTKVLFILRMANLPEAYQTMTKAMDDDRFQNFVDATNNYALQNAYEEVVIGVAKEWMNRAFPEGLF